MTWEDAWFVILLAFITIWGAGFYWWGYIYGKEKGEQIAKNTRHACQLEIERVKRNWDQQYPARSVQGILDFTEAKKHWRDG